MTLPFSGIRIVDLTSNFTGPMATMLLADQGADVIKVEALAGDVMRKLSLRPTGGSPIFANLNRGKKSIALDLTSDTGRRAVEELAATADVFIQNFRPGVIERLGLGPDVLRPRHPQLIYVSISGYGHNGPLADVGAYDHVVQSLSGMAALQAATLGGKPELIRHGVVDKSTAYMAAHAIGSALFQRTRTGEGSLVDVAMLDVALHFFWPDGMADLTCLTGPEVPGISRSFRLTPTKDGYLSIAAVTDEQFKGLVHAAGCGDVLDEPGLQSVMGRQRNGAQALKRVAAVFAEMTTEEVAAKLREFDVPFAPALPRVDVPAHPQVVATGTLSEIDHPELGPVRQPRSPIHIDGVAPTADPSPRLGQHTADVLAALGWTADEIATARESGTIA